MSTQIASDLLLLATAYDHKGVLVDLYGTSDDDGIEVEDVRVSGISVIEWLSNADLRRMEDALERQAVLDAQKERYERQLNRVCDLLSA